MLLTPIMDTDSSFMLPDHTCQRFTLAEIQSATQNFDDALVIGRGGFGKVYKCPKIGSMSEVAVKRLHSMSNQGAHEFEAEIQVLSKLRHGNLVSLVGYCNDEKEMVLVYEFMPNGTLEDHLRKPDSSLSWLQRLKICVGAAQGLDYLHRGTSTQHGVIHRDVKTSNILLDANFVAKVSDFGLAKVGLMDRTHVSTAVKGTFGYMDPSYFYTGKLTRKSDVYAFGVVLFELLSGRKAVDSTLDKDQCSLANWAQRKIKEGKLNQIIDPRLNGQIYRKCLKEFARIARYCLHTEPKQRPTMAEVVVKLESILSQEREIANSVVSEEGLIYKLRSIFTGKVGAATGSKSDFSMYHEYIQIEVDTAIGSNKDESFRTFTYTELANATNDFMEEVYTPTPYESIYKGWVDERTYDPTECGVGLAIYVRKIEIFLPEGVIKLKKFNHSNIVKLLGYCSNKEELFFVYELIPGTSLAKYLYGEPGSTSLSWVARLSIAVGAAEGLLCVHKRNQAAYRQFKTANILVDMDFNAWLSDFSFGPFTSLLHRYYAAPEWFRYRADRLDSLFFHKEDDTFVSLHRLSPADDDFAIKNEIYAFGVVLLEILTGMRVYDEERPLGKKNLVEWAIPLLADEVNLGMIMDPQLQHNDCPPKGAFKLAQLVLNCLHPKIDKRPSMEEILQVLNQCYQEREIANSVVSEEGLIYKLRSIFTGKVGAATGSKSDFSMYHEHIQIKVDTAIGSNKDESFRTFTYTELANATNDFKEEVYFPIPYESIYKGWVDERTYDPSKWGVGLEIYVRKIAIFLPETVIKLKKSNHSNFVKLLGYCSTKKELFFVYELIPSTSLAKYLYREIWSTTLPWVARLSIAVGAAEGLLYVHKRNQAAYRQFKTTNILVDMDFIASLSDFSFGPFTFQMGRYYAHPEWVGFLEGRFDSLFHKEDDTFVSLHRLSPADDDFAIKNEIYAFGVVLLEILTGMGVYDMEFPLRREQLVERAIPLLADEVNLGLIMDPQLQRNSRPKGAFKFAQLVFNCLHPKKEERPSMEEILQVLNQCYEEEIKTVLSLKS